MVIQLPNHDAQIGPVHRQRNKMVSVYDAEYSIRHSEHKEHIGLDLLEIF
jgi:hypothetical protein